MDFSKIEDIELEYEYKRHEVSDYYSQIQGESGRTISPDKNNIRFSVQNNDVASDNEVYQIILNKEDNCLYVKGDFFTTPENWYESTLEYHSDHVALISEDEDEKMILKCWLA
ncbi:hypothetical protein [Marinomonas sp. THO17]|uniref:hypothetical protein n=1 Tax=Marinomonas sp. THO17 TaxID=3149048 RepID=UPI00336BBD05